MTNPNEAYVGVNPDNPDAIEDGMAPTGRASMQYGDATTETGPLLTEEDSLVAKRIVKMWTDQDTLHQRYLADCRVNELRRQGHANVEATKVQDRDEWLVTVIGPPVAGMNKARALCRKFVATLFADPPEPDPKPAGADDVHRDQSEFSKEVLDHLCGEGSLDLLTAMRRAETDACTFRRGYVCFYMDPAGARIPLQIEAHPQAVSAQAPFGGEPDPMGQPTPALPSGEAELRYVGADGTLSDDIAKAAWTWAPKLRRDIFDGRHVRMIPATAEDLWDATGVLIASFTPLRDLKRQFPELLKAYDPEKLKKFPAKAEVLRPGDTKKERQASEQLKGDDALIFTLRCYLLSGGEYPNGFYGCVLGEELLAHNGEWMAEMPDGVQEPLDLPLTEVRQWSDECLMDIVGAGNDLRGQQLGALLEHTDQVLNRKTFVPHGSTIGQNELLDNAQRLLTYNAAQGKPEFEDIPALDEGIYQMWEALKTEMQEDSGLGATAENLTGGNSGNSGRAKFAIIGQAQVGLSEPSQNLGRAFTRAYRIILQMVRGFFSKPQKLDFAREDGSYRERRWTGADLGSTKDVDLAPGTNSMLSPPQKSQQVLDLLQAGVQLDPAEVRESLIANIGPIVGIRENPFRKRILRQIGTWEEGPPDGWVPVPPQPQLATDPMTGGPIVGPDGQPQVQMVAAPDPAVLAIWEPVAADELPTVAPLRLQELAKAQSGASYQRWPVEWRAGFDAEFARMQQFSGVVSIPQQQQNAAVAAQQQAAQQKPGGPNPERANAKAQEQGVNDVVTAGSQ